MPPKKLIRIIAIASASAAFTALAGNAGFVVQDTGVSPGELVNISVTGFYTGPAFAGINNLVIQGAPALGFCIDPFHFSLSSSPGYSFRPLAAAPKLPGMMGVEKAEDISALWSMFYSPDMTAPQAAGFQVAIWEIVGGDKFSVSGNDYGAALMLQNLETYSGAGTRLIALSGPGQDYCIPMPESGSTLTFFALAAVGLAGVTRRSRTSVL